MRVRLKYLFCMLAIIAVLFNPLQVFAAVISLDGSFNDWSDMPQLYDPSGDETDSYDIIMVKWYPDLSSSNLYLYVERTGTKDKSNNSKDNDAKDNNSNVENSEDNNVKENDDRYDDNYNPNTTEDAEVYNDAVKNLFDLSFNFKFWYLSANFGSELGDRHAYVLYHPPSRRVIVMLFDEKYRYLWSANGKWGDDKDNAKKIEFFIPLSYLTISAQHGYKVDFSYTSRNDRVPDNGVITIATISSFPLISAVIVTLMALLGYMLFSKSKGKYLNKGA